MYLEGRMQYNDVNTSTHVHSVTPYAIGQALVHHKAYSLVG